MNFTAHRFWRFAIPLALTALGALICAFLTPAERDSIQHQILGFPESDIASHQARIPVLQALCFFPALASLLYTFGSTLDRYIAREFSGIFAISTAGLTAIWLLMDMADKLGDFTQSEHLLATLFTLYATRAPAVVLLLVPYSLLLSLLYTVGKFSSSREIISMIQTGRSVIRITLPLILAGAMLSIFCLGLNYQWAPTAENRKVEILAAATGKVTAEASSVIYLNLQERRLWRIGAFPKNYEMGVPLVDVEITTTREDKTLESRLTATSASWDRASRSWTFNNPIMGDFPLRQPPIFSSHTEPIRISNWRETPSQLIKPGLSASQLGIPDLSSWLLENSKHHQLVAPAPYLTQWHYRWALPFTCLVTVLLATPLGIHFSRHGSTGGTFMAVVLSALMLLTTSISLACGESGTIDPLFAAWTPNIVFASIGLFLYHRRVSNQTVQLLLRRCFTRHS
jgi:lipopolysaccharide export system permease protein